MQKIEKDGLIFEIYDSGVTVTINRKYSAEKVSVPPEVNGVPVTDFLFLIGRSEQVNVKYISLPESVKRLVFDSYSDHNINVEIDERNPYFVTDGKAVYTKDRSELVTFLAHGDEEYAIPDGCKEIGEQAFLGAKNLRRVIFPKGLDSIRRIAFRDCTGLTELELPEGLTEIGKFAFTDCTGLKKIVLPSTLEIVDRGAFSYEPFTECNPRLTVELPQALRIIGDIAFPNDWTLILSEKNKDLILANDLILSGDGQKLLCSAKPIETDVLVIPDNVVEIPSEVFSNNQQIEIVILPKTLRKIGESAFENMQSLKEINLENVKEIGDRAFKECKSLEKVSLKCDKIGISAFDGCNSLTEAEADCEIIEDFAFRNCGRLQKVVLKNTRILRARSFCVAKELKEIVLPYGLEEIEDDVFSYCNIEVLTIPKTVKQIGTRIADGVKEIHIYDNIKTDIRRSDLSTDSYILYVHSAETDEIKYAVPIVGNTGHDDHNALVDMFGSGVDYDFKRFDSYFGSISDQLAFEKFNAGRLRLKYDRELDEQTRRMYAEQLGRLAPTIAGYYILNDNIEELFDPGFCEYLDAEQMLPLIDLSARNNLTELTAFLMQLCHEKRNGG